MYSEIPEPHAEPPTEPATFSDRAEGRLLVAVGLALLALYAHGQLEHTLRFARQLLLGE